MVTNSYLNTRQTPFNVALTSSAIISWEKSAHRLFKTLRYSLGRRSHAHRARIQSLRCRQTERLDFNQDLIAELEADPVSPVNAASACEPAPGLALSLSAFPRGGSVSIDAAPGLPSGLSDTGAFSPPGLSFVTPQDMPPSNGTCGVTGEVKG